MTGSSVVPKQSVPPQRWSSQMLPERSIAADATAPITASLGEASPSGRWPYKDLAEHLWVCHSNT